MTEKPNSVCKWCGDEISFWKNVVDHQYWTHVPNGKDHYHTAEPVAEPAPAEPSTSPRQQMDTSSDFGAYPMSAEPSASPEIIPNVAKYDSCGTVESSDPAPQPVAGEGQPKIKEEQK